MADAIISVPIYDSEYKTLADLVVLAKRTYSFNFTAASKTIDIDTFEVCILFTLFGTYSPSSYELTHPLVIIPNSNLSFGLKYIGDSAPSPIRVSSSSNSITISGYSSYTYSGNIAVIS